MPFEAAAMKDLHVSLDFSGSRVCPCVSVYFLQVLLFPPTVQRHTAHLYAFTLWQTGRCFMNTGISVLNRKENCVTFES